MLNLLGRARKGSTFSPSGSGGRMPPPGRTTNPAPSAPGRTPTRRPRKKPLVSDNMKADIRAKMKLYERAMELLDREIAGEDVPTPREFLEWAGRNTPLGRALDTWSRIVDPTALPELVMGAGWVKVCGPMAVSFPFGERIGFWNAPQSTPNCGLNLQHWGTNFVDPNQHEGDFGTNDSYRPRLLKRFRVDQASAIRGTVIEQWTRPNANIPWNFPRIVRPRMYVRLPADAQPIRLTQKDTTFQRGRIASPMPYQRPAIVSTETGGRMVHTRGYHGLLKPGPRVKEVKSRRRMALNPLISLVTEGVEWIGMMHDNLPKRLQAKGDYDRFGKFKGKGKGDPTPQQQAMAVYRNINEVDLPGLFRDIVANHFEDKFFGKLGKAGAKLARDANWLAGPQFGGAL